MAAVGPYRGRLDEPDSSDGFWRQIHRQRLRRKALPGIIACLALTPAVAIALTGGKQPGSRQAALQRQELLVGEQGADPWGLVLGRLSQVKPWLGPRPRHALRPRLSESAIPAQHIQAAVQQRASELRSCYIGSESYEAGWGAAVVASILIRKDGGVLVAVGGDDDLERSGVSACIARTLSSLHFPAPDPEFGWVHLPLRFEP